ncbi:hypothetical protein L218DRAFT_993768 [Marasmius fiardii PR-910]|nr:hypothetical protein L218DRAFT_993768 [Marasmius fiardii PR-910]
MISQVPSPTSQPLQQRQRVRFNYKSSNGSRDTTSKSRPALVSPVPSVDRDTYSAPSKPLKGAYRHPGMSSHDEHLFVPSKSKNSQGHNSPVTPGSQVYPTASTLPQLQSTGAPNGANKAPNTYKTQHHSLPRRGFTPVTDSAHHKSSSASKSIHSNVRAAPVPLSRVDTAETRNRSQEISATRIVIKSSSRSTMDSSKASSSGALSSRDAYLRTSSRPDHKEVDGHVKRRRTGEDIKLKPIHEVEIGDHRLQNNASHLFRPPGLPSNRNSATSSAGTRAPVTVPTPPAETLSQTQTRRLSQILARASVVVLSSHSHHVDQCGGDEISVEKHQVNGGPRRGSLDVAKEILKRTPLPDSKGVDECAGEVEQTTNLSKGVTARNGLAPQEFSEGCAVQMEQEQQRFLSLPLYLSDPDRLSGLLQYLSFSDWCSLFNTSKEIRLMLTHNELLREEILETFLGEIGYCRWCWREPEPITISLTDMFYYLKTASTPTRYYVEIAQRFLQSHSADDEDDNLATDVTELAQATRSYNRLVLRLRVQSEMLEHCDTLSCSDANSSGSSRKSSYHSTPDIVGSTSSLISSSPSQLQGRHRICSTPDSASFSSPLYRPNRAASLRVFVPSPHGEWLSDASVLECEAELRRAELTKFMRLGDVIWDIALGDEKGNSGRLIWDGCYLLDLDYSYSSCGDIPRHVPSLALPPSYFHGIIQRGPLNMDPVIRMDVSPWGEEIARNLQLMQDKMVAETPQGLQNVVKWLHRTTFKIRPPSIRSTSSSGQRVRWAQTGIPIRDSNGQTVHSSWYGSIVIETDGTNECLDDLKERCGLGVFPHKTAAIGRNGRKRERHEGMVWRILRDKSRPGEIWIKVITPRERLM